MRQPDAAPPAPPAPVAAVGATVRLGNARTEQAVVGGTIRLATAAAVPPGMWYGASLPVAADTVAVYVPLRAIVKGWSGTTSDGWKKVEESWADDGTSRNLVEFRTERTWFATAKTSGPRLHVRIGAQSYADEGRTRRGFRYRVGANPPMQVLDAWWQQGRERLSHPVPFIQLMAPPRVARISDIDEPIRDMSLRDAERWAAESAIPGIFTLEDTRQQRTCVGRGLLLREPGVVSSLVPFLSSDERFRVLLNNPFICRKGQWNALQSAMQEEARVLGLDMESDAVVEWWLDKQGHDGAVFERGAYPERSDRVVVAFRRGQIVRIRPQ